MIFQNEHLTRQRDIIPMGVLGEPITIIGAGAIGGWTALALVKMGFCDVTVFDFDKVDTVNLNSQFYRTKDVGAPKVLALQSLIEDFTGVKIKAINEAWEGKQPIRGIVISAVDSMRVRKEIWEVHRGKAIATKAVIDPRMGAESALLFCMHPLKAKDIEDYDKSFYSDDSAVQERCTAKATIYTAQLLSGLVCKAVKDRLCGQSGLRTVQWDIKSNQALLWSSQGP